MADDEPIQRDLTVALPRSSHHLALLAANDAAADLILYRDAALAPAVEARYPGRGIALGREVRPAPSPRGLLQARRANRDYYRSVAARLDWSRVSRLILFLEGEPLERFILTLVPHAQIELWEDGLSHYLDLTGAGWYRARAVVQLACGFHAGGILRRRLDRAKLKVRDRFAERNLRLPVPPPAPLDFGTALLIGSPLVEDRIIGRRRLVAALSKIASASPWPVDYIPHPREDRARLREDIAAAGSRICLTDEGRRLLDHAGQVEHRAYLSALSTGLLDLDRHSRSVFVPGIFGLVKADRAFRRWPHCPVQIAGNADDLRSVLRARERA